MAECYLAIDAGGTSLKYALMDGECAPLPGFGIRQQSTTGGVLSAFTAVAKQAAAYAREHGEDIAWAGVCCPGPFDFALGKSRMAHKWPDALDVPIAPLLTPCLGEVPIYFLHDATAFLLGEGRTGAGKGFAAPCGVMLGTGLGFALMQEGRVLVNEAQGPAFSLWNSPFREGIAEDYVSRRALRARYGEMGGDAGLDVRDIAQLAQAGDGAAHAAFAQMGACLGDILRPVMERYGCDAVVLGGGMMGSPSLLMPYIHLPIPIKPARHLADAALRGIARYGLMGHTEAVKEVQG